jgi:hypothetical protein
VLLSLALRCSPRGWRAIAAAKKHMHINKHAVALWDAIVQGLRRR